MMRRWLVRPAAALFPLAALLGGAFSPVLALRLMLCYFSVALLSGCAAEAFRNAAAREPGRRRVDGRFFGGLVMILLAGAICCALCAYLNKIDALCGALVASICINIEHLFEERSYALGRREDGPMSAAVSALLLAAGLALDARTEAPLNLPGFYTAASAALGALIAAAVSLTVAPLARISLLPRNLGFFPRAAVQSLLYPALCAALTRFCPNEFSLLPALAGLTLWRLARTPCRRTQNEGRAFNLMIILACAVSVAAATILPQAAAYARALLLALICSLAVFAAPAPRPYAGAIALIAAELLLETALLPGNWRIVAICALCVAAVAANLRPALMRRA